MSNPAVQVQWDLESTVENTFTVAQKFIQIATTDNVQPFALLACERFGMTLPICRATQKKVEQETRLNRESILLSFAKAVIRQGGGETIAELSSNVAGLNFFALADALASTTDLAEAAATIQLMIDQSARRKELVPTEHHIKTFLEVLEPRLDDWLSQHKATRSLTGNHYPSSDGIEKLVKALRSLVRIGDEEADNVVITPHSCTSWILAFLEWCLGTAPNICHEVDGVLFAEPESSITLMIPSKPIKHTGTKIELFTSRKSLLETFVVRASRTELDTIREYQGMITVRSHGRQTLRVLQCDSGFSLKAIREALPYTLRQGQERLRPGTYDEADEERTNDIDRWYSGGDERESSLVHLLPEFFSAEKVLDAMHMYLGEGWHSIPNLKSIPPTTAIADLPILRQWAQESESTCVRCGMARAGHEDHTYSSENYFEFHILGRLVSVVATILVLSLLDVDPEDLRLFFDKKFLLKSLVKHEDEPVLGDDLWIVMSMERRPCLTLMVIPGIFKRADQPNGPCYRGAISQGRKYSMDRDFMIVPSEQITSPSHFKTMSYEWRARTESDFIITTLSKKDNSGELATVNPFFVLMAIPKLVFANACPHNPNENKLMENKIEDYVFVHPNDFFCALVARDRNVENLGDNYPYVGGNILIFASRGNDALRTMIVGSLGNMDTWNAAVIGQMACFTCSLNLCWRLNSRILIC
ncbi:MAG: hypothetical protein Q9160_002149 [Pyrenula sp. 1 TL-2023]